MKSGLRIQGSRLYMLGVSIVIFVALGCGFSIRSAINIGSVEVNHLAVTREIDTNGRAIDPVTVFSTTTERIYVSFYLKTTQEVPVTTIWYKEDKLIFKQEGNHQTGWKFSWIEPKEQFLPGNYKVEIRWLTTLLAETEFRVEQSPI